MTHASHFRNRALGVAVTFLGALALASAVTLAPYGAMKAAAIDPPVSTASEGFELTAGATTLTGFAQLADVTVSTPAGNVAAMDLTATAATFGDLGIVVPCTAVPSVGTGMTTITKTGTGATSAVQGLEILATSLTVTISGQTPTTFLPGTTLPTGDLAFDTITLHGLWASMPSLQAPGLTQHTAFCTP